MPTPHPDALLRRADAAKALTEAGYPTPKATLATLACRGGGPAFHRYGKIPLYRWRDALAWAKARLSQAHTCTSEHNSLSHG